MTIFFTELSGFISSRCSICVVGKEVFIKCQNEDDYATLIRQKKNIESAINNIDAVNSKLANTEWVTIGLINSDIVQSFPLLESKKTVQIILPSDNDIITECLAYNGACGIVRMSDHKGLFSNEKIEISSKAHPNDWVGKKMSDYWYEDELNPYIARLLRDGELTNYSYVAKLMTGEPARLTVDARTIKFRGEDARIVKTLNRELLN